MKTTRIRNLTAAILALAAAFLLGSCMTAQGNRGSLGAAMGKARDDNTGNRTVPSPKPDSRDRNRDRWPVMIIDADDDGKADPFPGFDGNVCFGLRGGVSGVSSIGRDYDGWGDILLGMNGENFEAMSYAGYRSVAPVETGTIGASVSGNLSFLRAGLEVRYLPFGEHEYFAPFVGVGANAFCMFWNFQNPVVSQGTTIDGDILSGAGLTAQAGIYLARTKNYSVAVSVIPEVFLFSDTTVRGFTNDFFAPYATVSFAAEILYR